MYIGPLLVTIAACLRLLDQTYSKVFVSTGNPLVFQASSDPLYQCTYTASYSLFTWVKITRLSSSPFIFLSLRNRELPLLQVAKALDGSYAATAAIDNCGGTVTVSLPGSLPPEWSHIAVIVCATGVMQLAITPWQGATVTATITAPEFLTFDPGFSELWLGGLNGSVLEGQLLDTQFHCGVCASLSDVSVILASLGCYSKCIGGCSGPGDKSCNDYLQLSDEKAPLTMPANSYLSYKVGDSQLQERVIATASYSYTGWYYDTENARGWRNLVRFQTITGNFGVYGQRAAALFRNSSPYLHSRFDGSTAANWGLPDQPLPAGYLNGWTFYSFSVCNGAVTSCYALYPAVTLSCKSGSPTGGTATWGNTPNSAIFIGDFYYAGGIQGKIVDSRFYFTACKSQAEFQSLYDQKKTELVQNCISGGSFGCSTCTSGFYPSADLCLTCNSCCSSCSGPGPSACLACSPSCVQIAPTTCVSKAYLDCPPSCSSCSGPKEWQCVSCVSGLSLQPYGSGLCLSACPTGYWLVVGVCVGSGGTVIDLQFDSITPTMAGFAGATAVNGATLAYIEASDPLPSKRRGYYFTGSQYVQLPPAPLASGSPPLFATSFTFSAWIRPQGSGPRTLFTKKDGCRDILTVGISSSNTLCLVLGQPSASYTHTRPLTMDLWVFVAISWQFSAASGQTTASFYYDGTLHATVYTADYYIRDNSVTATQMIGVSAAFQDFYHGFIWRITLRNEASSSVSSFITSAGCPSGLSFCLSACPFSQTAECDNCQAVCTAGCVRPTDCSYCQDILCDSCPGFFTLQCTACIPEAVYTTQCDCVFGRYFNSAGRSCLLCSEECNGCSALTTCLDCYSNASLSGNTCICDDGYFPNTHAGHCSVCISACLTCASAAVCLTCKANAGLIVPNCVCQSGFYGSPDHCQPCSPHCQTCSAAGCSLCDASYYLLSGLCTSLCPSGYTLTGSSCIGTNQVVLDLTFDTITPRATGSSGVAAVNGASLAYWPPAFESTDPLPSKHRGYFFSGTQYLQLPPCVDALGPILTLSPWASFSLWLRPQGSGLRTLYSKASVLSLKLTGSQDIEMEGGVPSTSQILCVPLTVDRWTFLVLTIDLEVGTWQTTVSCYLDAVLVTTHIVPNVYLLDESTGAEQTIGSSVLLSDFYQGFLWAFSVSNYVLSSVSLAAAISSPSCPLNLPFCLSPCPFNETPDCIPCLSSCPFSCVRPSDCSPCSHELCEICSEFESLTCIQCLTNTLSTPHCECTAGRYFDRPERLCKLCVSPCLTCSSASICLSCESPAVLQGLGCACPSGLYMPSAGICSICPSTCLECDNTPVCTACPANSHLAGSVCECDSQYFGLPPSCQVCISPCQSCLSLSFCSSCYSPAYLHTGSCLCPINSYPNPTAARCQQCPSSCFTCIDASQCTSCWPNAILYKNDCVCPLGFYGLPAGCIACESACQECMESGCIHCQIGFFMYEKKCVAGCEAGYIEDKQEWTCKRQAKELVATLEGGLFSNLYLNFSSKLAKELKNADFSTVLTTTDGINITAEHKLTTLTANQHYNVSFLISPLRTTEFPAFLAFLSPLSDLSGSLLTTTTLSATLTIVFSSYLDSSEAYIPASSVGSAATKGAVVSGLAGSLLTGNFGSLFTMLTTIQLLAYLPLSGIAMPEDLSALLKSLNIQTMFPNPFKYMLNVTETKELPDYAECYGYESSLFLSNIGLALTAGVLTVLYALGMQAFRKCPVRFFALYFGKLLAEGKTNYMARYWIQVYLDISLAAYLQVFAVRLASPTQALNFSLGLLAALLCVATPFCVLYITLRFKTEPDLAIGKWWYGLFTEFKLDKGPIARLFYTLFFLRRLIYSISLLTLHNHSVYQSVSFIIPSICVILTQSLGYLIVYRPHRDLSGLITAISSEFCVFSVFALTATYNFPLSAAVSKALEQACTGLVFITIAGANAVMAFTAVVALKRVWGQYVSEVKKKEGISVFWTTGRKTAW